MLQLNSAMGSLHQHYENMNSYHREGKPAEWMHGKFWQIDEEIYDEFLGMLPPIYIPQGFAICEMLTGNITACFFRLRSNYWCGYCDIRSRDVTAMISHIMDLNL